MIRPMEDGDPPLPFPTRTVRTATGVVEEYIIPESEKAWVLEQLYPFDPVPSLNEVLYDMHEGKRFRVRDFRVVREGNMNFLVSPYYPKSGGSVIDWMPSGSGRRKRK